MRKFKDLTGQKFGRLIVNYRIESNKERRACWNCTCDCGNKVNVPTGRLVNGNTKSCGCYQKERASKVYLKNLTGNRFGRLIVVSRDEDYINPLSNRTRRVWLCRCDCGEEVKVASGELLKGDTTSCGCYQKERASEARLKDLVGQKFGKLTVIYRTEKDGDKVFWHCSCDCGKEKDIRSGHLVSGAIQSCGCLSESYVASELKKFFIKNYNAKIEYNVLKNPTTGYYLPYDIYIPDETYVEVNGKQHYEIQNWHKMTAKINKTTPEFEFQTQQERDELKKKFAKENGKYIEIDLRKVKPIKEWINYIEKEASL